MLKKTKDVKPQFNSISECLKALNESRAIKSELSISIGQNLFKSFVWDLINTLALIGIGRAKQTEITDLFNKHRIFEDASRLSMAILTEEACEKYLADSCGMEEVPDGTLNED